MRVNHKLCHVIQHFRNQLFHVWIWCCQAWVRIAIYQPSPEVFINKKVKAEELEAILPSLGVKSLASTQKCVYHQVSHSRDEMLINIDIKFAIGLIKEVLEVKEAHDISLIVL